MTLVDDYLAFRRAINPLPGETVAAQEVRIQNRYDRYFRVAQSRVHKISDADLHILLRAAIDTGKFTETSRFLNQALTDLNELASRGQAVDRDYLDVYQELVHYRRLTEAKTIFRDHHVDGMEPIPTIIDQVGTLRHARTEYQISSGRDELIHRLSVLPKTGILVTASPHCGYAVNAAHTIHNDPILGPVFRDHSKWLAPPDGRYDLSAFQDWNNAYPEATLSITYRQSDWEFIKNWGSPTFYFFRNGRLIRKLEGWRQEGGGQKLEKIVRSLGLINPSMALRQPEKEVSHSTSVKTPDGTTNSEHNRHLINLATAPIKSKGDLDAYLKRTPPSESPFLYLSPLDLKIFLDGLIFDKSGLTQFPPDVFKGLAVTQAYKLLALFGWQLVVPSIPDLREQDSLDTLIKSAEKNAEKNDR